MRRRVLARMRLPLTIVEHLNVIALLERRHGCRVSWRHVPERDPRWVVFEREAS